ncbi:hypothetical protein BDQ17DRAFT_1362868 [Cyathus striatus]|nr:hypothetical protein BDQ17DRAFT_1362868 [Cyathus striatus]
MDVTQTDMALRVMVTVLHVVAVAASFYRFFYQRLVDCLFFALLWMATVKDDAFTPHANRVRFWLTVLCPLIIVWLNHITMILSVARIFPPSKQHHRLCVYISAVFVFFLLSIATKWLISKYGCVLPPAFRVLVCSMNAAGDTIVIAIPFYILYVGRPCLSNWVRRLRAALAAGAFSSIFTVVYIVFMLAPPRWEPAATTLRLRMGHLEASGSLIMSHICFCVAFLMSNETSDDSSVLTLTEVEIDSSDFEMSTRSLAENVGPSNGKTSSVGTDNNTSV